MDKANPKDFLRALETARTASVHVECDILRGAIKEAVASELEELAEKHASEIQTIGARPYLLARAREIRNFARRTT